MPSLSRQVFLRVIAVRRAAVLLAAALWFVFGWQPQVGPWFLPILVAAGVAAHNELGGVLLRRVADRRVTVVSHVQVALDAGALVGLLHVYGAGPEARVAVLSPAFFVIGAVQPLPAARFHALLSMAEMALLGASDRALALSSLGALLSVQLAYHLTSLPRGQQARMAASAREAEHVRALLEVSQHATSMHSVDDLLRATCDSAVAFLRVPRVSIFLWDGNAERLVPAASRTARWEMSDADEIADPAAVARLREGATIRLEPATPGGAPGFVVPMVCGGWFQGALLVRVDDAVTDDMMALVQGMAQQAALALVNVRTLEQRQEDAEVSRTLLALSQAVSACLDEDVLWDLLVRSFAKALDVPWAMGLRWDEGRGTFRIVGARGIPDAVLAPWTDVEPAESPVLRDLLADRQIVCTVDAVPPVLAGHPVGSWIAVPLSRGSWMAGVLVAGHAPEQRVPFPRRALRVAEGVAHHASVALQNAGLFADLEKADRLKSEFLSTVSHELRTPLNVIIGYTEMLREGAAGDLTTDQRDLVGRLDTRGRELLDLVEATLQVNRLEAGRDEVKPAPLPLCELVRALEVSTAGLPRSPGVAFEWRLPEDTACMVRTDRTKLALIVRNLVGNAFKFTSSGSVEVRLELRRDLLVVEVEDTGIGIAPDQIPIIFDMFRQVDGSETRRHDGVGLGLYIVKQFVTRLGGRIEVESAVGSGSTFRLTFPGAVVSGDARAAA